MLSFNIFKSWTFWGSLAAIVGQIAQQPTHGVAQIVTGLGALVGVIGARNAVAKAATVTTDAVNNVAAVTTQTAASVSNAVAAATLTTK